MLRTVIVLGAAGLLASWVLDETRRRPLAKARKTAGQPGAEPRRDDALTAAIENTFPASDPYRVSNPTAHEPGRPVQRRPAAIDPASVQRQVELLERKRGERGA